MNNNESVTSWITMSHVTHKNESRHTHEWVMTHTRMRPVTPRLQKIVLKKICVIKCAAEIHFTQGSCDRQVFRFAIASPDSSHVFRVSKCVQNGHVWFKSPNLTELTCMRGIWMTHITDASASYHAYKCVISRMWSTSASYHTCEALSVTRGPYLICRFANQ